jgi:hypothetical protein
MNKFLATIAIVAAFGLAGTSANAGIFSNVVGNVTSPIAQAKRSSSPGPDMSWLKAVTKQRKKFENAENYRSCVNLYGQTAAAVKGCQKVWANKLPNAENNDNYRRCANMYGVGPCQKIWVGKL